MSTDLKSIIVLFYDFSFKNEILLFSLLLLKTYSTSKDFLKSFWQLLSNYFNVVFCIFKCILFILMGNTNYYQFLFYSLFIQTKINKQTKQQNGCNKKNYNMKYHVILGRFKWLINVSPSLEGIRYPRSVYVLSFVFFSCCCCCFCIHLRSNLDGF